MTGISSGYSVALRPYVFVSLILFCFMPVLSRACTGHRQTIADSIPVLEIKWLNGKNIELDGNLLEPVWKKANEVAIRPPWGDTSRIVGGARFFFDDHFLYFAFKIKDSTVNIFTSDDELSVAKGDRAEIFFSRTLKLNNYYCFEISPSGLVLDYHAKFYRKLDYGWGCPEVKISTHLENNGYVIEGRVPMKFIRKLIPGSHGNHDFFELYAGVFSADFYGGNKNDVVWNSWVIPDSKSPDFHIPSAFGKFIFSKEIN